MVASTEDRMWEQTVGDGAMGRQREYVRKPVQEARSGKGGMPIEAIGK